MTNETAQPSAAARNWRVKYAVNTWARWHGVIVKGQLRQTIDVIAEDEAKAKAKVRKQVGDTFVLQMAAIENQIAKLNDGDHLFNIKTFRVLKIVERVQKRKTRLHISETQPASVPQG